MQPVRAVIDAMRWTRAVVVLAAVVLVAPNAMSQAARTGAAAPEIDLPTLAGGHVKLSALKGKPVVVTFWGTWCPPCREEFPALVAAQKEYRDAGLVVLAVNQRDQEFSTKAVQAFVNEFRADFTVALDGRGQSRRRFRLVGLPTTIFVDTAGVVQVIHPGPISQPELKDALATIVRPK